MKDFCIELNDSSESLALIGEMLGAADVNIKGLCLTSYQERSIVHFIVEDADTTRRVLEDSDIRINDESEVYILNKDEKGVTGRPGSFGGI